MIAKFLEYRHCQNLEQDDRMDLETMTDPSISRIERLRPGTISRSEFKVLRKMYQFPSVMNGLLEQ